MISLYHHPQLSPELYEPICIKIQIPLSFPHNCNLLTNPTPCTEGHKLLFVAEFLDKMHYFLGSYS